MSEMDDWKKRAVQVAGFAEKLLGNSEEMTEEELNTLCAEMLPEGDPANRVYELAAKAARQYRLRNEVVPSHVQAALDATKEPSDLDVVKPLKLQEIIDKALAPFAGPVAEVSYAYRNKKKFSDLDRKILDEIAGEVKEDWGKDK